MAKNLSAVPHYELSESEARRSGWDPELEVPVVEVLGYEVSGSSARLNRVGVSANGYLMVSGSTGGGTLSLSDDATNNRVSSFSQDAGLMRVSAVGGSTVTFDADAANNRVSAVQRDAANLHISAKSQDAGLFRVSAVGGTAGDNVLVDGVDQTLSASLGTDGLLRVYSVSGSTQFTNDASNQPVSAIQEGANRLRVSAFVDSGSVSAKSGDANQLHVSSVQGDGGLLHVSALQSGTWAISSLLKEGTAFVGQVSATLKAGTASIGLVSATLKEGTAFVGQVSAKNTDAGTFLVSAAQKGTWTLDSGSVSAKNGDGNQFHVCAVQGDAGLLHVSAVGVSLSFSDDASDQPVSAKGTVSAFINEGSVSAKSPDANQFHVSAYQGGSWTLSAFLNEGSVSAKSNNADQFRISSFSNDASLMRVSAVGGTTSPLSADSSSISAKSNDAGTFLVSAAQKGTWSLTALLSESTAFIGNVSGKVGDAGNFHVSAFQTDAASFMVSAKSGDAGLMRVSAVGGSSVSLSADASGNRVSAFQDDGANLRVSAIWGQQLDATNDAISAKSSDAGTLLVSAKSGDAGQFHVSADTELPAAAALSDSTANPTAPMVGAAGMMFDGTNWVRVRTNLGDGSGGGQLSQNANMMYNGSTWDRVRGDTTNGLDVDITRIASGQELSATLKEGTAFVGQVSAQLAANTAGALSVFQSISVSASQNVKSTAGSIYGYYAWNSDSTFNYLKLYNVSGAVNKGTDTPIMTIALPPSAAANVEFPHGLVGFTNGIGIAATSGAPVDNTANPGASAVGINLFYK